MEPIKNYLQSLFIKIDSENNNNIHNDDLKIIIPGNLRISSINNNNQNIDSSKLIELMEKSTLGNKNISTIEIKKIYL